MIRHNWQWKLVALCLSIFLWSYVNTQRNPKATKPFTVPIQIMNLAKGYAADLSVQDATVQIEGYKSVVDQIRQNDISAWVDLDTITPSNGAVTKTKTLNVRVSGIPQEDISATVLPKKVQVTVKMIGKKLPVEVKFLSAPPLGYTYGDPDVNPASISVSGKIDYVSQVKKVVLTLPPNASSNSVDSDFPLVPMDSNGNEVRGVSLNPPYVRLRLALREVPAAKEVVISCKLQGKLKSPAQYKNVTVYPSSVILEGRPNILSDISMIETAPINVEGMDKTFTRQVNLIIPNGTKVKGTDIVSVTIEIE
jgi:YbbR domain-containing protein